MWSFHVTKVSCGSWMCQNKFSYLIDKIKHYVSFPRASVHVESSEYDSLGRLGNRSVALLK